MRKKLPVLWLGWVLTLLLFVAAGIAWAEEAIPAKPTRYFNDYALTVKPETADRLNAQLEDLEKQTSNQVLVAIYPRLPSDSDVADYCNRVYRAWGIGQKDKNNGAVLFVFVQDHKLWIQPGRGLEGALPDATCKDITADKIAPRFKAGDYDGGLSAGVDAMIQATKGEYKGSGRTEYEKQHPGGNRATSNGGGLSFGTILLFFALFLIASRFFRRGGGGGFGGFGGGPILFGGGFGGGGSFGGGGWGGGGSSSGGGGFSSGGGDSGGGGAGSDW